MRRFNCVSAIVTLLILAAMPTVAQSIFVSNDEFVFADGYVNNINVSGTGDMQFATNSVQWMTGGPGGTILILVTSSVGLTYNTLATDLTNLGYSVTGPTTIVPTLTQLLTYKAIFLSSCEAGYCPTLFTYNTSIPSYTALENALIQYVQQTSNPGNVFILAGTTCHDARVWNTFLNAFGLTLVDACNNLGGIYNVVPFQTTAPYGQMLFGGAFPPGTDVNAVYIDNGNNVQSLMPDCGVQIFNDTIGSQVYGLYGAWKPCCYQTAPRRATNRSVKPSVMPAVAQDLRKDAALPPPPSLAELYDNGPVNGMINAWTINYGFSVSNSFEVKGPASVNGIEFWAWLELGDSLMTLEEKIGYFPFDNTLSDAIVGLTQSDCSTNMCGYSVCHEASSFNASLWSFCPTCYAGYWVTLTNAVTAYGEPAYWDENYGVGCGGFLGTNPSTCPSSAVDSSLGPVPSEAFTMLGH
jgi:hypothetical protein